MADFLTAWDLTKVNEGGYSNVIGDNGGETYMGITRKNFPNWIGWMAIDKNKPLRNNQVIGNDLLNVDVQDFYKTNFWNPIGGDEIDNQDLANQVFDMAVNSGVGEALKLLKQA